MQNLPLFPRSVRLILYAATSIATLASVPSIIAHARHAMAPMTEEDPSATDSNSSAATTHTSPGLISIQPVGPQTALHRQAELARLRTKLASTRAAE